ncbi:MAG: cytochrome C oxidase subunit II [Actinomycetota bacterium]|nr:cytochrome C oxidase subunit II [Actinomycetota bacterium]
MINSHDVLWGQTLLYTAYVLVMISVIVWFAYSITKEGKTSTVSKTFFWSFVAVLVVVGFSLHLVTYNTIPWVKQDLHRGDTVADQQFDIVVADHEFILPADEMIVQCNESILFDVTSNDLTYGFGLFRDNNSMVMQMQVVPGHRNDILWKFEENESLTIRSTEYSGPAGFQMIIPDAVTVVGCS